MKLTSQMIKDKAKELGIDCIAIGNIERFKEAPKLMSPITVLELNSHICLKFKPAGHYSSFKRDFIIYVLNTVIR